MSRQVWTSGFDLQRSGVGVIQRHIFGHLERASGWTVQRGPDRPVRPGQLRQWRYKIAQAMARTDQADVALVTATPRPVGLRVPYVAVVYDLRWMRTVGALKRSYRRAELRSTVRGAQRVLVISRRTLADLLAVVPSAAERTSLLPLGPGQCAPEDFCPGVDGTVLLVGDAPHKRNRTMIEALAYARPAWFRRLVCVNVDPEDTVLAIERLGEAQVDVHRDLTPEAMVAAYRDAAVYASLSIEEGFGIPYVEALCAGAQVLAIDQPLTRELLGDTGVLLQDGDLATISAQLVAIDWPDAERRRARASMYAWEETNRVILETLEEVCLR